MSFGRSDVLTCPVDAHIIIEDSECESETECEGKLPLLCRRAVLGAAFLEPLVAEGMNTDPGTQATVHHRDGTGDSGDDAMRSDQLSEDPDGGGGGDVDDSDNDNNVTRIGLQVIK